MATHFGLFDVIFLGNYPALLLFFTAFLAANADVKEDKKSETGRYNKVGNCTSYKFGNKFKFALLKVVFTSVFLNILFFLEVD